MTRLKIEVVGEDDRAALYVLRRTVCDMAETWDLNDSGYTVRQSFGTATATVEREETTEAI